MVEGGWQSNFLAIPLSQFMFRVSIIDMHEMSPSQPAQFDVIEASEANVPSLSTIVARAFHPSNAYIKKVLPDTPALAGWWSKIFADEIKDASTHLLIAVDPDNDTAVGLLSLRRMEAAEKGAGTWGLYELTPDHDVEGYKAMIDSMGEHRERLMLGRPHYLIQLFGVDAAYAGRRIGQKLLARACDIADAAGLDTLVQANGNARAFYEKQEFVVKGKETMPGDEYVEYMLVRPGRN
ncbi:hypothetical protein LTR27_004908 [Elasticomyces elasticus]|nr:hypothetical protein LTR27_004908 [Elasticomyces elasticus]